MHSRLPVLLALALAAGTARADTSATLPTAINLPKGPASIEGFGQGHDTSPASGLPTLSYALEVPPGRAGLTPELALHYDAGEGAGAHGLGWSLGLPTIERSLRTGIPTVDVGAPQLAMHSARELMGAHDVAAYAAALHAFLAPA